MLTDWPRSFTALAALSTSPMDMPATKRLERRLPMDVFSAIARMDLLSDNQMKKARSKLTFVPQCRGNGHVTEVSAVYWTRSLGVAGCFPATAALRRAVETICSG